MGKRPPRSILKTPDTSQDTGASDKPSRGVRFDSITIRNYSIDIGDHPCCSIGAPVSLSWSYEEEEALDLDIYEIERRPRRPLKGLVLSYYRRRDILRNAGHTDDEIKAAARTVARAQRHRQTTLFFKPVGKLEEAFQSAGRKMKRATSRRKKSQET